MCLVHEINQTRAEEFAGQMVQLINHSALSYMVSIGHRTGLFDTIRNIGPSTCESIAKISGLNERYVREWLSAMVTGKILRYDPDNKTFFLPAEHAAFLTREAGSDNMAVIAQYFAVMGSVEDKIVECFYKGGGVSYEEYKRFHEVMAEDSGASIVENLFEHILPLSPGLIQDLEQGIEVLDIGCGQGRAVIAMAKMFPRSRFYGFDLCLEPIQKANIQVRKAGLKNAVFEQVDLTYYSSEKQYDLVTAFDAIHDQGRPDLVLKLINSLLKDDGVFLMVDINGSEDIVKNMEHPLGAFLYTVSTMHCMTVSLAQGGMGLGTMWGTEKAIRMLNEAGFSRVKQHDMEHDPVNCYFVVRK
jgi:2-polyprenyl-3-methyl-5-hydroxy-6-metoxy-1,4-benzoquinol methylase